MSFCYIISQSLFHHGLLLEFGSVWCFFKAENVIISMECGTIMLIQTACHYIPHKKLNLNLLKMLHRQTSMILSHWTCIFEKFECQVSQIYEINSQTTGLGHLHFLGKTSNGVKGEK